MWSAQDCSPSETQLSRRLLHLSYDNITSHEIGNRTEALGSISHDELRTTRRRAEPDHTRRPGRDSEMLFQPRLVETNQHKHIPDRWIMPSDVYSTQRTGDGYHGWLDLLLWFSNPESGCSGPTR